MTVDTARYRRALKEKVEYMQRAYGQPVERAGVSLPVQAPDLDKLLDAYDRLQGLLK